MTGAPITSPAPNTAEGQRLEADQRGEAAWKRWGPYLSERAWGTVREDYSASGDAWGSFPHDHARSRAYRWNEDGLLGVSDHHGRICLAPALWNGRDPILKERAFGLTNPEGNHGEDVKECFFFLESTPTHSYARALYKYPQAEFPYARLVEENRRRTREDPEFELIDSGVFDQNRYWDVEVEYAKAGPEDLLVRITAHNRGPEAALLHVLPQLWFRNTWSWGEPGATRPRVRAVGPGLLEAGHPDLGPRWLHASPEAEALFCENETNFTRLYGVANRSGTAKDGIHERVIGGRLEAVQPGEGSKVALWHRLAVGPGGSAAVRLRFSDRQLEAPFEGFDGLVEERRLEGEAFHAALEPPGLSDDERLVRRQAIAGMLWGKQHYRYDVGCWLDGDPAGPPPPAQRLEGRNAHWRTLAADDLLSVPDKWEYPWFAAWDLAFHAVPLALVDPEFAKGQLVRLTREWFMRPDGQLPAYEWAFGDVNPPVHAWAAWKVYTLEERLHGRRDRTFLERVFHKLLLNFTWWVNRKDTEGMNVFQGGFLGLDNVSVFDRSQPLPGGGRLEQADGTAWMGMFCLSMLRIALELAEENSAYEDIASKFFEHFLLIAGALNDLGGEGLSLWDEADGFYYDALRLPPGPGCAGRMDRLELRSVVGLIPLLAVETLEPEALERFPGFRGRLEWLLEHRPALAALVPSFTVPGKGARRLLALTPPERLERVLARVLDPAEFLSEHGVRSLSRWHLEHPFELAVGGPDGPEELRRVAYEPGESRTAAFGGNSNWRGPVWLPVNYLLVEALESFDRYHPAAFLVECPTGSGLRLPLSAVADGLARRLVRLFTRDAAGRRAVFGGSETFQTDPLWRDLVPFHEYFHGDSGAGLGAAHQTGWTGLVAELIGRRFGTREGGDGGLSGA